MKKARFHSEFHTRVTLNLKAPEGDDPRAVQMQALIREFSFQVKMGLQNEWVIQAMLDRVAREMNAGIGAGAGGGAGAGTPDLRLPAPQQARDLVQPLSMAREENAAPQALNNELAPPLIQLPDLGTADLQVEEEHDEEMQPPPPRQVKPRGLMNAM